MHELSICLALIDEVMSIAADHGASDVSEIHLSIGVLSGVEAPLVEQAFPLAAAGSVADKAVLHIHQQPLRVRCESCGEESEALANRLVCGSCNDWRTEVVSGDGLILDRICMNKPTVQGDLHV